MSSNWHVVQLLAIFDFIFCSVWLSEEYQQLANRAALDSSAQTVSLMRTLPYGGVMSAWLLYNTSGKTSFNLTLTHTERFPPAWSVLPSNQLWTARFSHQHVDCIHQNTGKIGWRSRGKWGEGAKWIQNRWRNRHTGARGKVVQKNGKTRNIQVVLSRRWQQPVRKRYRYFRSSLIRITCLSFFP